MPDIQKEPLGNCDVTAHKIMPHPHYGYCKNWKPLSEAAAPAQPVPPSACPICCADWIRLGIRTIGKKCPSCYALHTDFCECELCKPAATSPVLTPASNAITKCAETSKCVHGVRLKEHCAECPQSPPLLETPVLTQPSAEPDEILQVIDERDHAEDMADKLAHAIAEHLKVDIGEHSNLNEPWTNALEALLESERPVLPVPPKFQTLILHAKQLLEWVPMCSKGSSGFVRQENLRKSIEEIEAMNANS